MRNVRLWTKVIKTAVSLLLSASVNRRDFIKVGGLGRVGAGAATDCCRRQEAAKADFTLQIAPVTVELAPDRVISTVGYNGMSPGPILKMREGVPVTVDVVNDTDVPEQVHWHGLLIPPELDGADEEGTPPVPPHGRRRYQFTPRPAGTRWYHTHTMAMTDLHRGSYTGQFGFLMVESGKDPGQLRSGSVPGAARLGAVLHQPARRHRRAEPEVAAAGAAGGARHASQRARGRRDDLFDQRQGARRGRADSRADGPARAHARPERERDREPEHRASRAISSPSSRSTAIPCRRRGRSIRSSSGPGERVDAYVEMNQPGVWIMGAPEDDIRNGGLGIVVEYANQRRQPQWVAPAKPSWDYTVFGKAAAHRRPPAASSTWRSKRCRAGWASSTAFW